MRQKEQPKARDTTANPLIRWKQYIHQKPFQGWLVHSAAMVVFITLLSGSFATPVNEAMRLLAISIAALIPTTIVSKRFSEKNNPVTLDQASAVGAISLIAALLSVSAFLMRVLPPRFGLTLPPSFDPILYNTFLFGWVFALTFGIIAKNTGMGKLGFRLAVTWLIGLLVLSLAQLIRTGQ